MSSVGDLPRLAASFARHLQAENKSAKTIATYGEGVHQLLAHLAPHGILSADQISNEHVDDFIAVLLETKSEGTANNRFRALQQFFKRLEAEGTSGRTRWRMRPPTVPEQPVPVRGVSGPEACGPLTSVPWGFRGLR